MYKTVYLVVAVKIECNDESRSDEVVQQVAGECDYNISMPVDSNIRVRSTEIIGASESEP